MARLRFNVGDKVLASRNETGDDHEPGVVIDSYELIIGEDKRPAVVIEFEDGERKYMTAATPNVLAVEPEEDEAPAPEQTDAAETDAAPERVAPAVDDELGAS
jgi:hypothetical protein